MAGVAYSIFILSLFVFTIVDLNPVSSEFDEYFFIFGDGLYDSGNTRYLIPDQYLRLYHSPFGNTFFKHPTGRFSDGRTVADFIADKVGFPDFIPPALNPSANFTYGANFATPGPSVFDIVQNHPLNFRSQIRLFRKLTEEWILITQNITEVHRRLNKAVYLIAIGIDDTWNSVTENTSDDDLESIADQVVGNISDRIKALYDFGARKFVFQNVPALHLFPYIRQTRSAHVANLLDLVAAWELVKLPKKLQDIQENDVFRGFNFTIFSYYHALAIMKARPENYGLKESNIGCCGNSTFRGQGCGVLGYEYCVCGNKTEYLFFDGVHNTDAANEVLAQMMWNRTSGFVSPYGVEDFFGSDSTSLNSAA